MRPTASTLRFSVLLLTLPLAGAIGCAGGLPAVLSSTSDTVAVEFEREGSLAEAGELAQKECAKVGKESEFQEVDKTATPNTRVAKFKCVSPTGSDPATE